MACEGSNPIVKTVMRYIFCPARFSLIRKPEVIANCFDDLIFRVFVLSRGVHEFRVTVNYQLAGGPRHGESEDNTPGL